jgi:hypothetical protein
VIPDSLIFARASRIEICPKSETLPLLCRKQRAIVGHDSIGFIGRQPVSNNGEQVLGWTIEPVQAGLTLERKPGAVIGLPGEFKLHFVIG